MDKSSRIALEPIAHIVTSFPTKFGVPRQSGLVDTPAKIVFTPKYRVAEALRGIEDYSYLWLIWGFSEVKQKDWSPTVRPPRLGGNKRMGVFATRSPFRPNGLGLSSVRLIRTENTEKEGTVLIVTGADMVSGTPIYDIKPYLPFADAHVNAGDGFAGQVKENTVRVVFGCDTSFLSPGALTLLTKILEEDPRPHYQNDENREYAFEYDNLHITFCVDGEILTVKTIQTVT